MKQLPVLILILLNIHTALVAGIPTTRFTGSFQWEETSDMQEYQLSIRHTQCEKDRLVADGRGSSGKGGRKTEFSFRIEIDLKSHEFKMWERDPTQDDFVTKGLHTGYISSDFGKIQAKWITHTSDKSGILILKRLDWK